MLEIKDVYKTFNPGTPTERRAVRGVSLNVADGDFVTIIGGNGAGKSTLLNLIAGVYECDKGRIILNGEDIGSQKEYVRAKYLGRVFQDPLMGTVPTMQIEENLALAARRGTRRTLKWGITAREREEYRERLSVLELGLEDRMTSKVGLLSGGQRQALTLLMAVLKKPRLLLLDEHTAALDPKTAHKVLDLTKQFVETEQLTTFMVTHNMRHAIQYGNRLIMMRDGRVVYEAEGEEKRALSTEDLLQKFRVSDDDDETDVTDRMILSQ